MTQKALQRKEILTCLGCTATMNEKYLNGCFCSACRRKFALEEISIELFEEMNQKGQKLTTGVKNEIY